ncbi:MAG: AAA family ATPase, partial [Egibacteraceae bacterium]
AAGQGQFDLAAGLAGDLISLLWGGGRLAEALALAEQIKGYTRRAGLGPWTQLGDEARRLQILQSQGYDEQVLAAVHTLRETMAGLAEQSDAVETVVPWNVREVVLDTGFAAALGLERWEEALALNAEAAGSERRRGASRLAQAATRFNDYGPLLRLGRVGEARAVLLGCRQAFEDEHDLAGLGKALSALADLENRLGRTGSAIRLEQDALRLKYAAGDPDDIAVSHLNLATCLQRVGQEPAVAVAHRLASAVIELQTGSGRLAGTLRVLAHDLAGLDGDPPVPGSFAELCRLVDRTDGVHLAQLVDRLPKQAPDGEAALAEVVRLASQLPTDQAFEVEEHLEAWAPVTAGIVVAVAGDAATATAVEQALTTRGEHPDWGALVARLRRILAGERGDDLVAGLDPIDTAIVQRTLDALAGRIEVAGTALPDEFDQPAGADT